ncbi:MAG TPA: hypothetical protein VE645_13850, partial [Pseudonocardiaceae bacterium]|nr:hypothetical protein [Pseudonocardiaceae bacterium]
LGYSLSVQETLLYVVADRCPLKVSSRMYLRKMEGKLMRILNRVIVAGALVVPMGLGVSGIAMADVAMGSSGLPTQIGASEDDDCGDDCDNGSDGCGSDGGDGGLLGLGIFESDDPVDGGQCEEDDDDANGSLLG